MGNNMKDEMTSFEEIEEYSVLIPDANGWEAVKFMRCFSGFNNIKFFLLSNVKNSIARKCKYCSIFIYKQFHDDIYWLESVIAYCKSYNINFIIPTTEAGFTLLINYKNELLKENIKIPKLPCKETFELTNNKWLFYNFLVNNKLPVEPALLVGEQGYIKLKTEKLVEFPFPALVKPASEKGGYGIKYINSIDEFNNYKAALEKKSFNDIYYMQGFIPGYDVSMAVYCNEGVIYEYAIHKSLNKRTDYFGPQRMMKFIENKKIFSIAEKCLKELKWDGIACIDFRVDIRDNNPKIIEFNPRFGQALLGWYLAGINFPLIILLDAFGKEYPQMNYKTIKYAHTMAHLKIILKKIILRKYAKSLSEYEGGLKFFISDPLPELFFILKKIFIKMKL